MPELLPLAQRRGQLSATHSPAAGQNFVRIEAPMNLVGVQSNTGFSIHLEQSMNSIEWFTLGKVAVADVLAKSQQPQKNGLPWLFWAQFGEQVVRHDVFLGRGWNEAYELINPEDGAHYHQLAVCPFVRLTVDSYRTDAQGNRTGDANLTYGLNITTNRRPAPPTPIGRRSASLVGTFAEAEGTGAITSGARATKDGSLITSMVGCWHDTDYQTIPVVTDNKSNTFLKHAVEPQANFGSWASVGLSYNIGGTRGAGHTLSMIDIRNQSIGGLEWDGVDSNPAMQASASLGTSVSPGTSIASVTKSSLAILLYGYDGSPAVFQNTGSATGTPALEVDELNDMQAQCARYKVAQVGAVSISGALDVSRAWGALITTFSETEDRVWRPVVPTQRMI